MGRLRTNTHRRLSRRCKVRSKQGVHHRPSRRLCCSAQAGAGLPVEAGSRNRRCESVFRCRCGEAVAGASRRLLSAEPKDRVLVRVGVWSQDLPEVSRWRKPKVRNRRIGSAGHRCKPGVGCRSSPAAECRSEPEGWPPVEPGCGAADASRGPASWRSQGMRSQAQARDRTLGEPEDTAPAVLRAHQY